MLIDNKDLTRVQTNKPNIRYRESLLTAAVSIVLRDTPNGTQFLMMQRAHHDNDPWSGQMSFPGGKLEAFDEDHKAAAIRETFEEVGLQLHDDDYIGRLDDVYGLKASGVFSVHVASFVFKMKRGFSLKANHEVADMVWIPFEYLNNRRYAIDYYHPHEASLKMPAVVVSEKEAQIVWGLSLRILLILCDVIGSPMSALNADEKEQLKQIENREFTKKEQ